MSGIEINSSGFVDFSFMKTFRIIDQYFYLFICVFIYDCPFPSLTYQQEQQVCTDQCKHLLTSVWTPMPSLSKPAGMKWCVKQAHPFRGWEIIQHICVQNTFCFKKYQACPYLHLLYNRILHRLDGKQSNFSIKHAEEKFDCAIHHQISILWCYE